MITVRRMTADDAALGMRLKDCAGWNQLEADWRRALALEPEGCFVGLCDGTPAATLTTCRFGAVAWVAMVLTDPALRGRGLATALVERAIVYLEACGTSSIRLDATLLGRPVYEKFGFVVDGELVCFHGTPRLDDAATVGSDAAHLLPIDAPSLPSIAEFDLRASGTDRSRLLACLHREWPETSRYALREAEVTGFVFARRGSRAVQLGPCIAADDATGAALLAATCAALPDRAVYVDVPCVNPSAAAFLQHLGLREERRFFRMTRGTAVQELNTAIWASSGPEKG